MGLGYRRPRRTAQTMMNLFTNFIYITEFLLISYSMLIFYQIDSRMLNPYLFTVKYMFNSVD